MRQSVCSSAATETARATVRPIRQSKPIVREQLCGHERSGDVASTPHRAAREEKPLILVALIAGLAALIASSGPALALDKVTLGLNWLATPESGGFYQAVVDGTYAKYGLDDGLVKAARLRSGE